MTPCAEYRRNAAEPTSRFVECSTSSFSSTTSASCPLGRTNDPGSRTLDIVQNIDESVTGSQWTCPYPFLAQASARRHVEYPRPGIVAGQFGQHHARPLTEPQTASIQPVGERAITLLISPTKSWIRPTIDSHSSEPQVPPPAIAGRINHLTRFRRAPAGKDRNHPQQRRDRQRRTGAQPTDRTPQRGQISPRKCSARPVTDSASR